jgi:chromate transporter
MSNLETEQIAQETSSALTGGVRALPLKSVAHFPLWQLLRVWFMLGLQSFGGGTATLFLIRRAAVEQYGWLSAEEFTHDWAICLTSPGINLLCMTILVGRRIAGLAGALVALLGLLLPSVTITIIMTALYADLRTLPVVQAALRGIVPATVGLGLLLSVSMARPLLAASQRESPGNLLVSLAILGGSALAMVFWHLPVIVVLCVAAGLSALTTWRHAVLAKSDQAKPTQVKAGRP